MAEEKELVLPEYFPLVDRKKACQKVATTFFDCFTLNAAQEEGIRSKTKGQEGLAKCVKELGQYKQCMEKVNIGKDMRFIRAPEAYLEILGKK